MPSLPIPPPSTSALRRAADPSNGIDQNAESRRRAYHRPSILERQRIETMAADCSIPGGKNDATCILGFS